MVASQIQLYLVSTDMVPVPYLAPVLRVSTKILLVLVLRIRHRHGSLELLGPKSGTTNVTEVMGGAIPLATKVFAAIVFQLSRQKLLLYFNRQDHTIKF